MSGQLAGSFKPLLTMGALKWLFSRVNPLMEIQLVFVLETFLAEPANVWLTLHMDQFVEPEGLCSLERFRAFVAFMRASVCMSFLVSKQIEFV